MIDFYCLAAPDSDRYLAAGDLASTPGGRAWRPCPANPGHARCVTPDTDDLVWPLQYYILITGRVAELLRTAGGNSFRIFRLEKNGERFTGDTGFGVGSLADNFPRLLALKYGQPLQIA